jgi:SAM-dependent methyltransferase
VHPDDFMIGDSPESAAVYNRIGSGAVDLCIDGLTRVNQSVESVRSILDFGCGYGRVTRAMVQRFHPGIIDVFDVDSQAPIFCAHEFGVRSLVFKKEWDWNSVNFKSYNLIWVGSVFTHLSEPFARETLSLLYRILKKDGMLVFTTHGEGTFQRTRDGFYGKYYQALADDIEAGYREKGIYFTAYQKQDLEILPFEFKKGQDFGMTWLRPDFVQTMSEQISDGHLHLVEYRPLGWEQHQDTYFFQQGVEKDFIKRLIGSLGIFVKETLSGGKAAIFGKTAPIFEDYNANSQRTT